MRPSTEVKGITSAARIVLAALVVALVLAPGAVKAQTPVGQAADSLGLRLLDVPDAAREDPRARLYIVDSLAPGTTIHRRIEVTNTASPQAVSLYAAAATVGGGSFEAAEGHSVNELSMWTSVDPGATALPARGRAAATVTIAVPADASPGERYGVVWAEVRSAGAGGVAQVNRVGIRIYLAVGAGAAAAADFAVDSLTARRSSAGRPEVVASVHNTGGRALDMVGMLELENGPGDLRAGPFAVTVGTTLGVGDTAPVTIELDDRLPAGPWDAVVTLHSGLVERTAEATITFPPAGSAAATIIQPARWSWLSVVLAGVAAAMVAVAARILLHRRQARPSPAAHAAARTAES